MPGPVTTPHREALIRLAQDAFASEHLEYRKLVAEPHRKIMAEQARLEVAETALTTVQLAFTSAPQALTDSEASRRRLGEQHQPDSVIVRRRTKEFRGLRAHSQTTVTRAQGEVMAIKAELAAATEEAKQHHDAAAIRVERIHQYIHRRLAVHRRTLIRFHPDGAWANSAMSTFAPEIPGWALPDAYVPKNIPIVKPPAIEELEVLDPPQLPAEQMIELTSDVTYFGSAGGTAADGAAFVEVDSPVAAAWHFTIKKAGTDLELLARGYGHGPFIGGTPVNTAVLKQHDYFDFAGCRYTMADKDHLRREPLGDCSIVAAGLHAMSGSKPRLTGMSFVQRENTLLAVLGPSGAGKSSLCFALLGELPLQSGQLFFGQLPMETHSRQIRDQLGFVPQETKLHMSLTVEATLRYGFSLRSSDSRKKKRDERVQKVLKDTSLEEQRGQLLSTLSGGQLRRVSIALELLPEPPLLMLDEPTSGLDASMDRQIMDILRTYARNGHTVLIVTHNTEHLWMASQILTVVQGGTPVFSGAPRRIRKHFNFKVYADLMSLLLDPRQRQRFVAEYRGSDQAKEAQREVSKLTQQAASATPGRDPATKVAKHPVRDSYRQFGVLVSRQVALVLTRALKDNERSGWQQVKNGVIVALPLLVAMASAALAAFVAGPPGLGAKPSQAGQTALALLTTLCVLSGQALTYSDVVNEFDMIKRESRAGVGAFTVLASKWLIYAVMAVAQAGLITVIFCAFSDRGPQRSVLFGPEADLFVGLAALSITAMTLGLLISAMSSKLEHAVVYVTGTSIAQIALNGVTSSLAKFSFMFVLAAALPDRWGLAAAASSIDLRGIDQKNPALASTDPLWAHSTGQWLIDLAALVVLGAIFFVLAVRRLNARLRLKGTS